MLHKDSKSKKKGSSGEGNIINQVIILTLNFKLLFLFFSKLLYFLFCFYFNCNSFLDSIFFFHTFFFNEEGGGAGRTKDKFLVFISQLLLLYMKFSCSSTNQKVFIISNRNKYGIVSGVRKNGE